MITVRGYMDGDLLISKYGSIKIVNYDEFKNTKGWYEVSNSGINSHYIRNYIEDTTVIKKLTRPNIFKR